MKRPTYRLAIAAAILASSSSLMAFDYVSYTNALPASETSSWNPSSIFPGVVVKDTDWIDTHTLPQYNPANFGGAALAYVTITWNSTVVSSNALQNTTSELVQFNTLTYAVTNFLGFPVGVSSPTLVTNSAGFETGDFDLDPLSGPVGDFAGSDSFHTNIVSQLSSSRQLSTAPDLAVFTGAGNVTFTTTNKANSHFNAGGGAYSQILTATSSQVIVSYAYVPESTALIPAGVLAGFVGVFQFVVRRNRKA